MRFRVLLSIATLALALCAPAQGASPVLIIPRMHLRAAVSLRGLEHGPWLWHRGGGNLSIAGHRVTHTHPFKHLDFLRRGDRAYFAGHAYRVVRVRVLPVASGWVVRWRGLVLSACAEPSGAYGPPALETMRLVVFLRLVH